MKNIIKYNLYATYDTKANTLGVPFIAQNNEVALRHLKQLQQQYEKTGLIGAEDLTIMYLCQYQITPEKIYDQKGNLIKFENIFSDTENSYNILNAFDTSKEKESQETI